MKRGIKKRNQFIRDQFEIDDSMIDGHEGKLQIMCKHCGQLRTWMNFNASIATKHILEQCPRVSPMVKAEASSQTQKGRRRRMERQRGAEDGEDEEGEEEYLDEEEEDGEGGGQEEEEEEGDGTPRKRAAKRYKKAAGSSNHNIGRPCRGDDLVMISKDELQELRDIKKKIDDDNETAKREAERIQRETDVMNARINMASNLLEKRQTLLDKGVSQADIEKLLPLSLIEQN